MKGLDLTAIDLPEMRAQLQVFASQAALRALVFTALALPCAIMPVVFMATLGSYISFIQTGDLLINRYWRDPRVKDDEHHRYLLR
jgi:hypothetical protein